MKSFLCEQVLIQKSSKEQGRKIKRCKVSAQDFHRFIFAAHLRSKNHLLKTKVKARCEIRGLVLSFGSDYDNQLLSEAHSVRAALAALIRKMKYETCNKEFSGSIYENGLRSQIQILNINRGDIQRKRCEYCNVELRSSICEKHVRPKKHIINQGRMIATKDAGRPFPSPRELAVSSFNKINILDQGNKTSTNPFYLVDDICP